MRFECYVSDQIHYVYCINLNIARSRKGCKICFLFFIYLPDLTYDGSKKLPHCMHSAAVSFFI